MSREVVVGGVVLSQPTEGHGRRGGRRATVRVVLLLLLERCRVVAIVVLAVAPVYAPVRDCRLGHCECGCGCGCGKERMSDLWGLQTRVGISKGSNKTCCPPRTPAEVI